MYIKRYTIAAFILMAMVGAYVFAYITQDTISIDLFGIPLPSLMIAIWVLVPLFVLYLASVLHMSFYAMVGNFKLRKFEKDFDTIVSAIADAYLGKENRHYSFKTDRYKFMGTLLENTTLYPIGNLSTTVQNEKLNSVLKTIEEIKNGNIVDLKPYNLSVNNQLVVQNERNRYKKGELTVEDLLANSTKYNDALCKEVYTDFVAKAPLHAIEKYKGYLTKESLYVILSRVNADSFTLEINNDVIVTLVQRLELSKEDFIKLSAVLSTAGMIPEQRMRLFEMLSEKNEDAVGAYLFTLFDLEMLAPADEILDNSQNGEFEKFKAYRALKECNKNFNIELFV
jgi:hypothetical protein